MQWAQLKEAVEAVSSHDYFMHFPLHVHILSRGIMMVIVLNNFLTVKKEII